MSIADTLENLIYKNLHSNTFEELENEVAKVIEKFKTLTTYKVKHNESVNIPKWVYGLNLTSLDLSYSKGETLPRDITKFENLKELRLDHSEVKAIPVWIRRLQNLEILSAYNSDIDLVSNNLFRCKKLRELTLTLLHGENDWHKVEPYMLSEDIGNLTNLEKLSLYYSCGVTKLPESIGKLTKLKILDLSYCVNLTALPESICNLTELEELDISGTKITELPENIGNLTKLKKLKASVCDDLEELPESFSKLTNLEHLDLMCCEKIDDLDCLENLVNLETLNIQRTAVTRLPSFEKMTKLNSLNMYKMEKLKQLPQGIKGKHFDVLSIPDHLERQYVGVGDIGYTKGDKGEVIKLEVINEPHIKINTKLYAKLVKILEIIRNGSSVQSCMFSGTPYNVGQIVDDKPYFFLTWEEAKTGIKPNVRPYSYDWS